MKCEISLVNLIYNDCTSILQYISPPIKAIRQPSQQHYVSASMYQSIHVSACVRIYVSDNRFIYQYVSIGPSTYRSIRLSIDLSANRSAIANAAVMVAMRMGTNSEADLSIALALDLCIDRSIVLFACAGAGVNQQVT